MKSRFNSNFKCFFLILPRKLPRTSKRLSNTVSEQNIKWPSKLHPLKVINCEKLATHLEQNVVEDSRPEQHQNHSVNHSDASNYCHDQLAVPLRKISKCHLCFLSAFQIQSQNDLLQQHCQRTWTGTFLQCHPFWNAARFIHTPSRLISFNNFVIGLSKVKLFLWVSFSLLARLSYREIISQSLVWRAINEVELVQELCTQNNFNLLTKTSSNFMHRCLVTVIINKCVNHFDKISFYRFYDKAG